MFERLLPNRLFCKLQVVGDERGYGKITLLDLSLSFSSSNILFEAPIELGVSDIVMNILA